MLNTMTVSAEDNAFAYFLHYPLNGCAVANHVRYVELFLTKVLVMKI